MNILTGFKNIKAFVFDVDGVLTDGFVYPAQNGEQVRRFNIKDGYALQLAVKNGYKVIIISGSDEVGIKLRLQKLGIEYIHLGISDKKSMLEKYIQQLNLEQNEVLFMGDDMPDIAAMKAAGLACCPADAANEIKALSQYISPLNGGFGCVRDVVEKVLKLNDHWNAESGVAAI